MLEREDDGKRVVDESVQEKVSSRGISTKDRTASKSETSPSMSITVSSKGRAVKPNRRSEETINSILEATEEVVLESGADRISILDVCKAAGVSRGTFYRYFSSQEDLLDTFSRHKRDAFHQVLMNTIGTVEDPEARLNALIAFIDDYLEQSRAQRLLVVAPDYALGFFRRIFHDSILRFQDTLNIVFDDWDEKLGVKLDRELICEIIIRYVLSEILVPENAGRRLLPVRVKRLVASLTMGSTSRTRR
tara:strand:- start:16989 stop:17732 length:744 start_codon:yes stop_codon:yes gene_type:complete